MSFTEFILQGGTNYDYLETVAKIELVKFLFRLMCLMRV